VSLPGLLSQLEMPYLVFSFAEFHSQYCSNFKAGMYILRAGCSVYGDVTYKVVEISPGSGAKGPHLGHTIVALGA